MPISSYQEMASAACWYPCPPAFLPFDVLAYGDLLHVSWTYRSLTLVEGRPDVYGVHLTQLRRLAPRLGTVQVQRAAVASVRVSRPTIAVS